MGTVNKAAQIGRESKLRTGLEAVLGRSAKVKVEGEEVKIGPVLDVLDAFLKNAKATDATKVAYDRALAAERAYREEHAAVLRSLCLALVATLSAAQLSECGLAPPKKARRTLSADERTAATMTLRDTRKANRTRGTRQAREEAARAKIAAAYSPTANGDATAVGDATANGAHAETTPGAAH